MDISLGHGSLLVMLGSEMQVRTNRKCQVVVVVVVAFADRYLASFFFLLSQHAYEHSLLPTKKSSGKQAAIGPRINITFRIIKNE